MRSCLAMLGAFARRLPSLELAPVTAFLVVYLLTCWIGGMALLGLSGVREWYVYLSGAAIGRMLPSEVVKTIVLLNLPPVLLVAGWSLAGRLTVRYPVLVGSPQAEGRERQPTVRALTIALAVVLVVLYGRLALHGAVENLSAWLDYDAFIAQRNRLVAKLSFADFVFAYSVVPLLMGSIIAERVGSGVPARRVAATAAACGAALLLLDVLLFQKRPLFVSMFLLGAIVILHQPARRRLRPLGRRVTPLAFGTVGAAYAAYLVLLVGPVMRSAIGTDGHGSERPLVDVRFEGGAQGWLAAGQFTQDGGRLRLADGYQGRGLKVTVRKAMQGASYDTGLDGTAGSRWMLTARIRSVRGRSVSLIVGGVGGDDVVGQYRVGKTWKPVTLPWTELADAPAVSLAARMERRGEFLIDDVKLRRTYAAPKPAAPDRSVSLEATFERGRAGWNDAGSFLFAGARLGATGGHRGRGMSVVAPRALTGAVYPLRRGARAGRPYIVQAWVRSATSTPVTLAIGRDRLDTAIGTYKTSATWKRITLTWTPKRRVGDIALAVRAAAPGTFALDDIRVSQPRIPKARPPDRSVSLEATFERGRAGWNDAGSFLFAGARLGATGGHRGRGMSVVAPRALTGAVYPLRRGARAGRPYIVQAWVRSATSTPVTLAIGRDRLDTAIGTYKTSATWKRITLTWTPKRRVGDIALAVRAAAPGTFALDDIRVSQPREKRSGTLLAASFERGVASWSPVGPLIREGAVLSGGPGYRGTGMRVDAPRALRGASARLGRQRDPALVPLTATMWVKMQRGARGDVVLGDSRRVTKARFVGTGDWQRVGASWRPARPTSSPSVGVRAAAPVRFAVDDVSVARGNREPRERFTIGVHPRRRSDDRSGVVFPRYEDVRARPAAKGLLFYALFGPFTRTAGPAVAYPALYPRRHDYYRVDIALDVLGIGAAPDDNRTSFAEMFPTAGDGRNSVPFAFALYSQGGVLVALLGALVIGFCWRWAWWLVRTGVHAPLVAACLGALLVLMGVFIAGDSARNALLASYGIVWPLAIILGWIVAERIAPKVIRARRRPRPETELGT